MRLFQLVSSFSSSFFLLLIISFSPPFAHFTEDPYYCGLQARVPNFAGRQRKSMPSAPVVNSSSHGHSNNGHYPLQPRQVSSQAFDIRKSQSNGYLNSLFNQSSSSSNFFPLNKKCDPNKRTNSSFNSSNPYYDSSLGKDECLQVFNLLFYFVHFIDHLFLFPRAFVILPKMALSPVLVLSLFHPI